MNGKIAEPCLICGGEITPVFDRMWDDRFGAPGFFEIARCRACETEQTIPRLPNDVMRLLYERYYNFGNAGKSPRRERYARIREWLFGSLIYRLWLFLDGDISFLRVKAREDSPGQHLLDVGCNEGRGLARYRANGFEAEGLELNRVAAEVARSRGFRVYTEEMESLHPETLFDVIVFSNVLEHTHDPHATLQNAYRLLRQRGEVWISLPNSGSVFRKIFNKRWVNWHVPYHLIHFMPKTLANLLRQENFELLSLKTSTPALWILQSMIVTVCAKPGQPTTQLRRTVFVAAGMVLIRAFLFPLLWLANISNRGDAFLIRARRIDH